jgi:hypothetical protein
MPVNENELQVSASFLLAPSLLQNLELSFPSSFVVCRRATSVFDLMDELDSDGSISKFSLNK